MRYYLLDNRYEQKNVDENGNVIGYAVKQPKFMKAYAYNKLGFKADGSQCMIQAEVEIPEAQELTLEEAQALENEWATEREPVIKVRRDENDDMVKDDDGNPIEDEFPATPLDIASYDHPDKKVERDRLHAKYGG